MGKIGLRFKDVLTHEGISKMESRSTYLKRKNYVAKGIRKDVYSSGQFRAYIDFVETADGRWTSSYIHTSLVLDVVEEETEVRLYTKNSVYVFERVPLKELKYKEEPELIELFLSNEEADKFCKGIYYDQDKKPYDLVGYTHVGMFVDTFLIGIKEMAELDEFVCRYYIKKEDIEFYDTLYGQQDYSTRMLIHNEGTTPLVIKFEFMKAHWIIQPGEEKYIIPYSLEGVDDSEYEYLV